MQTKRTRNFFCSDNELASFSGVIFGACLRHMRANRISHLADDSKHVQRFVPSAASRQAPYCPATYCAHSSSPPMDGSASGARSGQFATTSG